MNIRTLVVGLISVGLCAAIMGCAGASSATDTTVSYIRGDQHATLAAAPPQIADATVAAAQELDLPVDSHSADGLVGKVLAHTSDGTKVEVNIKAQPNDQSEVTVRVGTFGDKALQQRVLDKIKAHLTAGASTPAVAAMPGASPAAAPPAMPPPPLPAAQAPAPAITLQPTPTVAPEPAPAPAPAQEPAQEPAQIPAAASPLVPSPTLTPAPAPANPLAPSTAPATMPAGF
jgi:hypothetical protein